MLNVIHREGEISAEIFKRAFNVDRGNDVMVNDRLDKNAQIRLGTFWIPNEERLSTLMVISAQLHHL